MRKEDPFPFPTMDPASRNYKILDAFGSLDAVFTPHFAEISEMFDHGGFGVPVETLRYTFGPLIVHCRFPTRSKAGGDAGIGWLEADIIDKWRPRVLRERLDILLGKRPHEWVSSTEIWLVMHNAMMDAPMSHHATSLSIWATHRSLAQSGWGNQETLDEMSVELNIPDDDDVLRGGDATMTMIYQDIARDIRTKVARAGSDRFVRRRPPKAPDAADAKPGEAPPPPPPPPVLRQLVVRDVGF